MRAGLCYGLLALLAGALLGPLRELFLAPRLGGVAAAWIEGAGLLLAIWFATRAALPPGLPATHRIGAAAVAFALLLSFEALFGLFLAASGLAELRAPRGFAELLPGYLLFGWLLAAPLLRARPKPRPE